MKKKSKKNYQYLILLSISLTILITFIYFHFTANNKDRVTQTNSETKLLTYTSQNKKVSFLYPPDYQIEEIYNDISLIKGISQISIYSIGTNYDNLQDYLNGLERMNKLNIVERYPSQINNIKTIRAVIKTPVNNNPDSYTYFFYPTEWTVYSISTDSKELRNDVDKIAETFIYNP